MEYYRIIIEQNSKNTQNFIPSAVMTMFTGKLLLRNLAFAQKYVIAKTPIEIFGIIKKYKTFSVLIYSYINTSGNWKNEKLCGNTTPAGRSVFTQFRVFPIFTSVDITVYQYGKNVLYFLYNIAQRTLTEEWREIFRVDIELYQHGS